MPKPTKFTPKVRAYDFPVKAAPDVDDSKDGSLFMGRGLSLFTDVRAFRPGDIITVRVEEAAHASRDAATETSRENSNSSGFDLFGFVKALEKGNPNFKAGKLWDSQTQHKFSGSGRTSRNDRLQTTLAAVVKKVLPRGNLFVEANKMILVNNEQHHFYLSGVVRPTDIDPDNSVRSSLLADAQIEFNGKGDLTNEQRPGWFTRIMKWIWPF
jgi:flagellar L-ring protein precursor FlgH